MKKESLNDELKDLSPWLHELKQQDDGFRLPEDYFNKMQDAVFARLESEGALRAGQEHTSGIMGRIRPLFRVRYLSAAAATIAVVLAALWFLRPTPTPEPAPLAAELSAEEIEAWMMENIHEFEADQLAALSHDLPDPEPTSEKPASDSKTKDPLDDLRPEDVEDLLKDMSEEELELIL